MARNSLTFSFLPGDSLWPVSDQASMYHKPAAACAANVAALAHSSSAQPTGACAAFLKGSEKAAQQWELEKRYAVFEASQH
jgi:adenosine deaminase